MCDRIQNKFKYLEILFLKKKKSCYIKKIVESIVILTKIIFNFFFFNFVLILISISYVNIYVEQKNMCAFLMINYSFYCKFFFRPLLLYLVFVIIFSKLAFLFRSIMSFTTYYFQMANDYVLN